MVIAFRCARARMVRRHEVTLEQHVPAVATRATASRCVRVSCVEGVMMRRGTSQRSHLHLRPCIAFIGAREGVGGRRLGLVLPSCKDDLPLIKRWPRLIDDGVITAPRRREATAIGPETAAVLRPKLPRGMAECRMESASSRDNDGEVTHARAHEPHARFERQNDGEEGAQGHQRSEDRRERQVGSIRHGSRAGPSSMAAWKAVGKQEHRETLVAWAGTRLCSVPARWTPCARRP